jgi:ABC-2 type transport system ATP-binding protein
MGSAILQIEQLTKTFRSHWTFRPIEAVRDISFDVFQGESFGFLGPNGAGKTTTIKCIMGLVHKTSGRIFYDGSPLDSHQAHASMGYLPELPYFYEHLTVAETLDFFAALHNISGHDRKIRISEVLEQVGLNGREKSPVRALSKGLQQRLGFAQAMINQPRMLFLDEPFSGLDPVGRREMRQLILELNNQGTTIFMSSHILSDVEEICDRVAIMAQGTLKASFYLRDIPSLFGERYELSVETFTDESQAAAGSVQNFCSGYQIRDTAEGPICVFEFTAYHDAEQALQILSSSGSKILEFHNLALSLEEIFIKMTSEAGKGTDQERDKDNSPEEVPRIETEERL